jgi:hypothetical protein
LVRVKDKAPPTGFRERLVIINNYDLSSLKMRKNKKDLFFELLDTLQGMLQAGLDGYDVQVIKGYTGLSDSAGTRIYDIMNQNGAAKAIVIKNYDVSFDQTEVQVSKDATGKSREAFYDICSTIDYWYYDSSALKSEQIIKSCRKHSSRNVSSGLLSVGPGIVSNRKDAIEITRDNANKFIFAYFRG